MLAVVIAKPFHDDFATTDSYAQNLCQRDRHIPIAIALSTIAH